MYCNILHRVSRVDFLDDLKFQQDVAHSLGFKTTLQIPLLAMESPEVIEYYKQQAKDYGDEIGLHFHNIASKSYAERFNNNETEVAIYLKPLEERKEIINFIFGKFYDIFGFYPASIGGYYFDADTLSYIKEKYPTVKIAIISCFEEGIKMFAGCNYGWYVFSEGGPWTAYYPSKSNSLCPAKNKEEAIDIIGVPHLSRDMLMSYLSRDDYFSSHSANMQRGKLNKGKKCPYIYDFLDQWLEQDKYNEDVYFNNFVGSGWLHEGRNFEEKSEDSKDLYRQCLEYYKKKSDEGKLKVLTLSEYADLHKENYNIGRSDVVLWKDIVCNSGRELFWYVDSNWRIALDPICGGSIVDLRPYAGRIKQDLGPNSSQLWNGSYPFALNFLHRQAWQTSTVANIGLFDVRMHVNKIERTNEGDLYIELDPIAVGRKNRVEFISSFLFCTDGRLYFKKKIISASDMDSKVKITETFKGTYGRTEYPEDIGGVKLYTIDNEGNKTERIYEYGNRTEKINNAKLVGAKVPMINTVFEYETNVIDSEAEVQEGAMFDPYYYLSMTQYVKVGEESSICLRIKKLEQA